MVWAGIKSQKSEYLRVAVYFGNHMKSIITLFEKHTELFKVKLLCAVSGSKTTAETVNTKKL
jgi:ribosomal protein L44E